MSSEHSTVTAFGTVISGLVLVMLGLALGWPLWAWAAAAAVFTPAALVAARLARRPVDPLGPEFTSEPDLPIQPPARREQSVADVALPSAEPDYDFRFSATVRWCPLEPHPDEPPFSAAAVAVDAVLERARALTEERPPHRGSLAQHQLNGELGVLNGRLSSAPTPVGPVELFGELLESLGVPAGHTDSEVLARCLHQGATTVGRSEATGPIRLRFDPAVAPAPAAEDDSGTLSAPYEQQQWWEHPPDHGPGDTWPPGGWDEGDPPPNAPHP